MNFTWTLFILRYFIAWGLNSLINPRVNKAMYVSELAKTYPQKSKDRPGNAGVVTNHLARILASHVSTWHVGSLSTQNPQKKTALAKCPAIQFKSTLFCPENSSLAKWRSRLPSLKFWRLAVSKRPVSGWYYVYSVYVPYLNIKTLLLEGFYR